MKAGLSPSKKVYSNDFVMARVDKAVGDLFAEKPSTRWDPGYWDPKHEISTIVKYKLIPLENYIDFSICGYRGKTEFTKKGIHCIEALCILPSGTGIDVGLGRNVPIAGKADNPNKRTQSNDLLFVRSGVGCAGRTAVVSDRSSDCVLGGHVFRVVLKDIESSVVHIWLKTTIGQAILNKLKAGVGALVLDEADIKSIPVPELPQKLRKHIEAGYKKMAAFHDKAMEAKAKGDDAACKKNLETAEAMLKDLIARTEAVIRGEREDVG